MIGYAYSHVKARRKISMVQRGSSRSTLSFNLDKARRQAMTN
jgi:hypothetical protein